MVEWIEGWKSISKYLDCSVRTAQDMARRRVIVVYRPPGCGVRADAKELDKHIKTHPLHVSA